MPLLFDSAKQAAWTAFHLAPGMDSHIILAQHRYTHPAPMGAADFGCKHADCVMSFVSLARADIQRLLDVPVNTNPAGSDAP